jgi:peptidoglycan hydrolase CwlO-like protein
LQWSDQVKAQKAELDVLRLQTEERIAALTAEVAVFEEGRARALAQVDALPSAAAAAAPAQRGRRYTAVPLTPPDEGMEHLVRCWRYPERRRG